MVNEIMVGVFQKQGDLKKQSMLKIVILDISRSLSLVFFHARLDDLIDKLPVLDY